MHDQIETRMLELQHEIDSQIEQMEIWLKELRSEISADALETTERMRRLVRHDSGDERWKVFLENLSDLSRDAYHSKISTELLSGTLTDVNRLFIGLAKEIQKYKEARDRQLDDLRLDRDLLQQKLDQRHKVHSPADRSVREQVAALTDSRCFYCDADLDQEKFHVDHIVPKAAGGPDHIANYVPACAKCNGSKGDRPFAPFFLKAKSGQPQLTVVSNQEDAA